ncbi:unnamed protein product [Dicrocoelium dendriticum]|nr:unnamed protein product [Dicrocoelium dendriticum]
MDSSNTDLREMREVTLTRKEPGQKFGIRIDNFGHGVYLTTVLRGSPAALAGLKVGDELIRLNGLPVSHLSATTVMILIRSSPSCLRITFKPRVLLARVREVSVQKSDGRIGIRIKQRSESLFVDVVLPKSPASFAGMKEGDELLMINNRNMRDWDQDTASQYLRDLPDGENVLFRVRDVLPSVCRHLLTGPAPKNTPLYKIKSSTLNTHSLTNSEVDVSEVDLVDQSPTKSSCCHCNLVQSKRYPQSRQGHQADCEQITNHGAPKLIIKGARESNVAFISDASTQGGTRLVNSISDWAIGQHQHAKCQ